MITLKLLKIVDPVIFKYPYTIMYLFRLVTIQQAEISLNKLIRNKRKENLVKNIILIILISTWLQFSSLMNIAFNNVLLDSYFNVKSTPLINTLQDVIDKKHFTISSTENWFKSVIVPRVPLDNQDQFAKRRDKYTSYDPESICSCYRWQSNCYDKYIFDRNI